MALSTDEKIALAVGAGLFFALLATLSEPPEPARPAVERKTVPEEAELEPDRPAELNPPNSPD